VNGGAGVGGWWYAVVSMMYVSAVCHADGRVVRDGMYVAHV
jgi:hypothetical protein